MPLIVSCTCPRAITFDSTDNLQHWVHRTPQLFITKDFVTLRHLRGGSELVRCRHCGRLSLVEETQGTCIDVLPEDLPFIERWERATHAPTLEQMRVLADIGATPPDQYGNGREFISFPCEGRLKGETYVTKMLVTFQKFAPLGLLRRSSPWRFVTEVEELWASDFALNRELRKATTRADEIHMGLAPTIAKAPNSREYLLNWTTNFFWQDDVKGSELKLCSYQGDELRQKAFSLASGRESHLQVCVVVGDWSEDLVKLRI